jgi:hypothetical protein
METSNHPGRAFASCPDHVVEWQLRGTPAASRHDSEGRNVRERIRALEAQALTHLRTAVTRPGALAAQRSLAVLDAEIARLRADLAWRRAEARTA